MIINSTWGKFAQRTKKTKVQEFTDPLAFSQFHESDKWVVTDVGWPTTGLFLDLEPATDIGLEQLVEKCHTT